MNKEEIAVRASQIRDAKYDEVAKTNLHFPKLIAPILKAVVPEYKACSIDDIVNYIVKDSISDDAVDDVSVIVGRADTEISSISDKLIRYDSRFKVINPELSDESICVYLHIDLEVQNDYRPDNPKYPIIKRAIYYGAREIGSQLGIITGETNYDRLEKVYSIWICNENIPVKLRNTVTSYQITKSDVIGKTNEPDRDYDLLNVIMIRRGNNEATADIFEYLTAFFTSNIDGICKYVNIRDDEEVMKGVERMTGLGQSIYQSGIQQGIDQGINQGINQGKMETLISLVKDGLIQIAEAAKRLGMSETEFSELLKQQNK